MKINVFVLLLCFLGGSVSVSASDSCPDVAKIKNSQVRIEAYSQCLEQKLPQETMGELFYQRGLLHLKNDVLGPLEQLEAGRSDLLRALDSGYEPVTVNYQLGDLEKRAKNYTAAISYYEKSLQLDSAAPQMANYQIGECYCGLGQAQKGIDLFKEMAEKFPNDKSYAMFSMAHCSALQNKVDEAIDYLNKAILVGPPGVDEPVKALYNGSWFFRKNRKIAPDVKKDPLSKEQRKAARIFMSNLRAFKAKLHASVGDMQNAHIEYDGATRAKSSEELSRDIAWSLATNEYSRLRFPPRALRWAKSLVEKRDPSISNRNVLAAAYAAMGQFDEAIKIQTALVAEVESTSRIDKAGFKKRLDLYRRHIPYYVGDVEEQGKPYIPLTLDDIYRPDGIDANPVHWEWAIKPIYTDVGGGREKSPGVFGFNAAGLMMAKHPETENWGLIDVDGNWKYVSSERKTPISAGDMGIIRKKQGMNVDYFDQDMNPLFGRSFEKGDDFYQKNNGVAWVTPRRTQAAPEAFFALIDVSGKEILTLPQADYRHGEISEGLTWISKNGQCGYYDTAGTAITPFKYKSCGLFEGGKGQVLKNDNSTVFIDVKGEETSTSESHVDFKNGLKIVELDKDDRKKRRVAFINQQGEIVSHYYWLRLSSIFMDIPGYTDVASQFSVQGWMNPEGEFFPSLKLITPANSFPLFASSMDAKQVTTCEEFRAYGVNCKSGDGGACRYTLLDVYGRVWIPGQFTYISGVTKVEDANGVTEFYAVVEVDGKFGVVRLKQESFTN